MSCLAENEQSGTRLTPTEHEIQTHGESQTTVISECIEISVNKKSFTLPPSIGARNTLWFERNFFKRIAVQEFLPLTSAARKDGIHSCRFGPREARTYNVAILLIFDDGVE